MFHLLTDNENDLEEFVSIYSNHQMHSHKFRFDDKPKNKKINFKFYGFDYFLFFTGVIKLVF